MQNTLNLRAAIQSLDPLRADTVFSHLPHYNADQNVQQILIATKSLLPDLETVVHFDVPEAHAAMRDLGMLMSAIKRYSCEPCCTLPELEPVVLLLSEKLKTVPRDTILDYSLWNPDEPRRRKYTTTYDEQVLIESVQTGLHGLYLAIATFEELLAVEFLSPAFVSSCRELNKHLEAMVVAIVSSIKHVSPRIFAHQLRPYWEPIEIGGQQYDGAGAAQLPICLIDHLLWASDRADSVYERYYKHTLQYMDDELRILYKATMHRPSLLTQLCTELSRHDHLTPLQKEAVLAVYRIFATLIKFRQPHKKLAYDTYEERYTDDPTVVGSSGHRPEILAHIIELTRQASTYLREQYEARL